jgi:hypothetical protein
MTWRKWLVRCLVFSVTGGLGLLGFLYLRWTNPTKVREVVIAQIREHLTGADVTIDSAQMRLLGGIFLTDVKLTKWNDAAKAELAYIPSAIVYPDKEKIRDGKFATRKIELKRPRLHVRRGKDGEWNVSDILGPVKPDEPIPTIVIEHGTIVVEDQRLAAALPPVEITDVNLTLINDPLPAIRFEGTGKSEVAGTLQLRGTWQRVSNDTILSLQAAAIPVGGPLIQRLGAYCPTVLEHAAHLQGSGNLQADFAYSAGSPQPWSHKICARLTGGTFHHAQCPLTLSGIDATIHCLDGHVTLDRLSAQAGPARVSITGTAQRPSADADFDGTLTVDHMPLSPEVFSRLPANLQKVNADFAPTGPVSLTYHCTREAHQWHQRCVIKAEDLTAVFVKFPYPLQHLGGTLDQEIDTRLQKDILRVDLVGLAGVQRVYLQGTVTGSGPTSAVDFKVTGADLPLDDTLLAALPPAHQKLAQSFHATGRADFEAFVHRTAGNSIFDNRYIIHFHDAAARYDVFPYPLEKVSGRLDIQPDHWEFTDFRGTHKGCEVHTSGRSFPAPAGDRIAIEVSGDRLLLDPELETALAPELKRAWKVFTPTGRMRFQAHVECLHNQPPDVDVTISALGCTIKPAFFPYFLSDLTGTLHYSRRWVHLHKLRARHGTTVMTVEKGDIFLKPDGGVWADMKMVSGSPLVPDEDLVRALPPALKSACETMRLKDPVDLQTRLIVATFPEAESDPDIFWDGMMTMHHATLSAGIELDNISGKAACRGRFRGGRLEGVVGNLALNEMTIFRQPFRDIQSAIEVKAETPNVLTFPGLRARIFGGEVYGPLHIEFGQPLRYEVNLTASRIRLEEFGQHNLGGENKVSGLATARLFLAGQGADAKELKGHGTVDVPNGRLYNLPLLLDLLKFLGLRLPDGTAFEEAHAVFTIHGMRVAISRLDLFGNSISLRGQGEMNLDGSDIQLDFYAVWARVVQWLPPIIKDIPTGISQGLLKIKMRGRINDLRFSREPVPVLVEPLKELLQSMAGQRR